MFFRMLAKILTGISVTAINFLQKKVDTFLVELARHPRTGTGQPEPMRHLEGDKWSRRIDRKHRLIYEIFEHKLVVVAISAYGHYGDK